MFDVVECSAKYHASGVIVSSCSGLLPCLTCPGVLLLLLLIMMMIIIISVFLITIIIIITVIIACLF